MFAQASIERATYELRRSLHAQTKVSGLTPEETAFLKAIDQTTQPIFESAIQQSMTPAGNAAP